MKLCEVPMLQTRFNKNTPEYHSGQNIYCFRQHSYFHTICVCVFVSQQIERPCRAPRLSSAAERGRPCRTGSSTLLVNRGLKVEVGWGQRVPSVLQRRHGRNWTHKSLWLSHLDEQCSQCLQWGWGETVVMKTHTYRQDTGHVIVHNRTHM